MNATRLFAGLVAAGLLCAPAFAGDGAVSQSQLNSLGLGQMKVMSDADGMSVRGKSSNARATSVSAFSVFLFDPNTGANLTLNGADFGGTSDENAGLNATSSASASTTVSTGAVVATITFNGITWSATIGTLNVFGFASATSP